MYIFSSNTFESGHLKWPGLSIPRHALYDNIIGNHSSALTKRESVIPSKLRPGRLVVIAGSPDSSRI